MSNHIDYALVERSIGFHGLPMQKVWEGEHGDQDLVHATVTPDFSVYQTRQKGFVFGDRTRRLQLHQFIARKADILFERKTTVGGGVCGRSNDGEYRISEGSLLPYNFYIADKHDKSTQLQHIYKLLNVGDIVYAQVTSRNVLGLFAKLLCTRHPNFFYLQDLNAQAFISNTELVPVLDRRGSPRMYTTGDHVVCEILEISPDCERMGLGMRGMHRDPSLDGDFLYGLTSIDQFPALYKELSIERVHKRSYTERLDDSIEFKNPHGLYEMARKVGLNLNTRYTIMSGLRSTFSPQDYSGELRQQQASKWAFRSVAEGIENFKEGRHSEAFQCLNKALSIDPRNVEGLVARGALYANSGSFKKAVDDFETALKLNASHANARKYMGETLVALGRSYEEEHNIEEAKNAYQACLNIISSHEEARNSLDFLCSKTTGKNLIQPNDLVFPALNLKIGEQKRGGVSTENKNKKSKKKKAKNRKRESSSSSSSSSDSSESSSPSNSSDSSPSSDSDFSKSRKRRRNRNPPKQRSLSPLSKRMASMANESNASSNSRPVVSATYSYDQSFSSYNNQADEYEMKVRKFLELTRDEDNYEQKVRQFVEEANRYRKDRKSMTGDEDKSNIHRKKEKHKKRKSSQRDAKKKRAKDKRNKISKRDKHEDTTGCLADLDNMELREALKIIKSLPGLDLSAKFLGMEKLLNQHQKETKKVENTKWKMLFAKDKASTSQMPSKLLPNQYAFNIDDDDDDDVEITTNDDSSHLFSANVKATIQPTTGSVTLSKTSKTSSVASTIKTSADVKPAVTPLACAKAGSISSTSIAATAPSEPPQSNQNVPTTDSVSISKPPAVVLDKFGSFRLATIDDDPGRAVGSTTASTTAGAGPLASTQRHPHDSCSRSRSGSRSRRRHRRQTRSISRSHSRSPRRRRRSSSRQYRRRVDSSRSRSNDRSRSRSGSYSRSRSASADRGVVGRGSATAVGGGSSGDRRSGNYYNRGCGNGTYYKPHFNHNNFRGNYNPMHYNNHRGNMGFRGAYNNPNHYYNNNNRGGYMNHRGGYQHPNSYHHYNNNGMHSNHRGRGGWINRGTGSGQHFGQYNRANDWEQSRGSRRTARDSRSHSADNDDYNNDRNENSRDRCGSFRHIGGVDRNDRRRRGRSSSRDEDDDESSVLSRHRSTSKAPSSSTTTTTTGRHRSIREESTTVTGTEKI